MKNKILLAILAIALVFGMTACSNGGGGDDTPPEKTTPEPGTAIYVSTDASGNRYTLEITEKVNARYVAKPNDTFKLTVELYKSGDYEVALVYNGTVSSAVNNNTEVKISVTVNGKPLNITIKGVEMTVIEGEIVDENGKPVVTAPESNLSTVFVRISALEEWLATQPANTADNPYAVKLNVNNLTAVDINRALIANDNKYVSLDLSGSTFTSGFVHEICNCTNLTSITLPVERNSYSLTFKGCTNLTSINVDSGNSVYSSENGVLYSKDKTILLRYPSGKKDRTFTIPNSVTVIGDNAFGGCRSLTSITIPNSVTVIGDNAFGGCTSLTSITIPNSVTVIWDYAFSGCTSLTSITIPNGVTSIGNSAFYGCTSLTSITIPGSVTEIGSGAFVDCTSLTSVTIPNGVTSIGNRAFYGCTSLTSITIPNSVTSIGWYNIFSDCKSLTSITIPNSVTEIGTSAFINCTSLTSVTIPNSVTEIGTSAFYGCTSLTSVTIPASVTSIWNQAFFGCTSLTSVTFATGSNIPNGIFGDYAFPQGSNANGNNLKTAYSTGKAGTYTRAPNGDTWTKQP